MKNSSIDAKLKREAQIIELLNSSSDERVIAMLIDLKESGEIFVLETLMNLISRDRSDLLKKAIIDFASSIKDKDAVPILVNFLTESFPQKRVTEVLTICWQSRLDFAGYLDVFFDILLKGNYLTAFEAFTVIENSLDSLSGETIKKHIAFVKTGIVNSDRDKQLLLLEMISVLEKAKREAQ